MLLPEENTGSGQFRVGGTISPKLAACLSKAVTPWTTTAAAKAIAQGGDESVNSVESFSDVVQSIDCSELKALGKCFNDYIAEAPKATKEKYELVRSKLCDELEKDTSDFAEIGKFFIRLFTCSTAGLCDTEKANTQAQKVSVQAAVGLLAGTRDQCVVDKGSLWKFVALAVVVALVLAGGAYYAGRSTGGRSY